MTLLMSTYLHDIIFFYSLSLTLKLGCPILYMVFLTYVNLFTGVFLSFWKFPPSSILGELLLSHALSLYLAVIFSGPFHRVSVCITTHCICMFLSVFLCYSTFMGNCVLSVQEACLKPPCILSTRAQCSSANVYHLPKSCV